MISINLATIQARKEALREAIHSIMVADKPEKDWVLNVMANDYDPTMPFLDNPRIHVIRLDNQGARAKFHNVREFSGHHFTCDDDLKYPKDYFMRLYSKIEKYGRKAICGVHGHSYTRWPLVSYYNDQKDGFHYEKALNEDTYVDCLGTGTMCFHTDTFRPDEFNHENMTDPEISIMFQKRKLPQICIARPALWVQTIPNSQDKSIWKDCVRDDSVQTKMLNEFGKPKRFYI